MSEFDDLCNEFFNTEPEKTKEILPEMVKLMERLNDNIDTVSLEETELGKPTTVRTFEKDGVTFEESTWNQHGTHQWVLL